MKKTSLLNSFKYAFEGIWSAIKKERNLKIHIVIMFLVIVFGIIFNISKIEWFACILLFGGVITLEIMNTAIETTVDLITMEKNPKAKLAKDASAGAVLVMAIISVIIGLMIFMPKILECLKYFIDLCIRHLKKIKICC